MPSGSCSRAAPLARRDEGLVAALPARRATRSEATDTGIVTMEGVIAQSNRAPSARKGGATCFLRASPFHLTVTLLSYRITPFSHCYHVISLASAMDYALVVRRDRREDFVAKGAHRRPDGRPEASPFSMPIDTRSRDSSAAGRAAGRALRPAGSETSPPSGLTVAELAAGRQRGRVALTGMAPQGRGGPARPIPSPHAHRSGGYGSCGPQRLLGRLRLWPTRCLDSLGVPALPLPAHLWPAATGRENQLSCSHWKTSPSRATPMTITHLLARAPSPPRTNDGGVGTKCRTDPAPAS